MWLRVYQVDVAVTDVIVPHLAHDLILTHKDQNSEYMTLLWFGASPLPDDFFIRLMRRFCLFKRSKSDFISAVFRRSGVLVLSALPLTSAGFHLMVILIRLCGLSCPSRISPNIHAAANTRLRHLQDVYGRLFRRYSRLRLSLSSTGVLTARCWSFCRRDVS